MKCKKQDKFTYKRKSNNSREIRRETRESLKKMTGKNYSLHILVEIISPPPLEKKIPRWGYSRKYTVYTPESRRVKVRIKRKNKKQENIKRNRNQDVKSSLARIKSR